jgi:hypothetical protein
MKYLIDKELLEEAIAGLNVFGQIATSITVEKLEKILSSKVDDELKAYNEGYNDAASGWGGCLAIPRSVDTPRE